MRILLCLAAVVFGVVGLPAVSGTHAGVVHENRRVDCSVLTLNIRYNNPGDGINAWPTRSGALIEYLKKSNADFIGLQEATPAQLAEVGEALDDYAFISRTREANTSRGEATPLFWNSSRWNIDPNANGTTWLSATPDTPGSKSWDSSLPRIVTWARFISRSTNQGVWVYNTHFDHRGNQLVISYINPDQRVHPPISQACRRRCTPLLYCACPKK